MAAEFEYKVLTLANLDDAASATLLNEQAQSGWELVTVDFRIAYLQRKTK